MSFTKIIQAHYKVVAEETSTKVCLSDSIDVKDFRKLMDKHGVKILSENKTPKGFEFDVQGDQDAIEGYLVGTHMEWSFG